MTFHANCLDARGRPTQVKFPAFGGSPARTVNHNHTWNGWPSATLTTDGSSVGSMVGLPVPDPVLG